MKTNSILGELMSLAVEVNEKTEKAVFLNFYGHVRKVRVEICKGKINDRFQEIEYEFEFRIDSDDSKPLSAITFLKALLPREDIKLHPSFTAPIDWDQAMDKGLMEGLASHEVDLVHRQGGPVEPTEYQFGRHPYDSHGIEY